LASTVASLTKMFWPNAPWTTRPKTASTLF
jgi:hypothetical protein